jgi:chromate transporter
MTLADDPPRAQAGGPRPSSLPVFARFLRFGFLAFGGPVAQIAMLRRELVDEDQ